LEIGASFSPANTTSSNETNISYAQRQIVWVINFHFDEERKIRFVGIEEIWYPIDVAD
jgi:hypothetical protein